MQINADKTQAITNINEARESATTQINTNKTESLEAIEPQKDKLKMKLVE